MPDNESKNRFLMKTFLIFMIIPFTIGFISSHFVVKTDVATGGDARPFKEAVKVQPEMQDEAMFFQDLWMNSTKAVQPEEAWSAYFKKPGC
jgi:hypothetical protein